MAYDKIITIHSRLDRRINYALNPAKTGDGERALCAALNCQLDTACQDMQSTKRRWDRKTALFRAIISSTPMPLVK